MRKWAAIVRATALEVLSEPLSLLVLLTSLLLTVMAPAFHYHQFGEVDRMARDAGFSALLTGGGVLAVFATIRSYRREIESGTLQMALAHAVSRGGFFLAKFLGAMLAYVFFAVVIFMTTMVIVEGALVGGIVARRTGDIARIFGPHLAAGVAVLLLPLIVAALLNRFGRFRFVLSAMVGALVTSVLTGGAAIAFNPSTAIRYFPGAVLIVAYTVVLQAFAAALAVRFKANAAASAMAAVVVVSVPVIGNYYLSDALSSQKVIPWEYWLAALAGVVPALAAGLLLGVGFMLRKDD